MKTMTAVEAKNSLGKFPDAAQREPVAVTKNSREVAAMFSINDLAEWQIHFWRNQLKQM